MAKLTPDQILELAPVAGDIGREIEVAAKRVRLDPVLTAVAAKLAFQAWLDDLNPEERARFDALELAGDA